jgi:hypothetical protein
LLPEAGFCLECGNPKDGIPCPTCHTLSIFDFCTTCGIPLTESAQAVFELAKTDPDAKEMATAIQQAAGIEAELAKLEALIQSKPEPVFAKPQERTGRFSESRMAAILKTDKNIDAAASRKEEEERKAKEMARIQEEQKKLEEISDAKKLKEALEKQKQEAIEAAQAALKKLKNKQFLTQQEARKFFNARRPPNASGWLCNFTNTVHPEGPNACDEPHHGGYWYIGDTIDVERKGPT